MPGDRAVWSIAPLVDPEDGHIEQPLVDEIAHQPPLPIRQDVDLLQYGDDVAEEDVGGRMRLAGDEDPEIRARGHRALNARKEGKGGGVALAGAGRALNEKSRGG